MIMIRFGGPVFLTDDKAPTSGEDHGAGGDPWEIAKAHKKKGYTAAYAPKVDPDQTERIKDIRNAFESEGVMLAEVQCWDNVVDTDEATRKMNMLALTETLWLAEELGARCAVDVLGSYIHGKCNSKFDARNFSDEAFDDAVSIARQLIDEVKPKTAYFAYEIFPFNVIDSPEAIEKLVKAVDRKQFGVNLDLVNLINCPRAYYSSGDIIRDCVKRFGDRIIAAHVKDIKMKEPADSVLLYEVIPGEGNIDMRAFVREIHKLPREIPFMMEHLATEEQYDQAAAYIRKCAVEENIVL